MKAGGEIGKIFLLVKISGSTVVPPSPAAHAHNQYRVKTHAVNLCTYPKFTAL